MLRTEIDKVAILFILGLCSSLSAKSRIECGYKQCPMTRDGALNVHLIPHSHMDAGWVKTFDQYYYGTKSTISSASVQLIYHSVLSELLHDKRRKFTFSESSYFWRWWKEQRPPTRVTFRALVQEGRIEFAGGSWVQNDEATVDYLQIIDQYTWGLRKLNDTLGPCGKPKAAWQIDTYGHSREQASLMAQMGYDGLFLGRVDYKTREAMMEEDRMEFMWRGSDALGKMSDIMSHTLFNLYNAPDGFCFDFLCSDEPIVDDVDNVAYNADKRVNEFIAQIERQAKYYDHDNIMVAMGGDFTYQSAANWFLNMDKLINHVNTHPANLSDINIFYSTPSCFLKAIYLYGRRDKALFTEREDLLPYGSDPTTYWTGFYSSRPSLKYLARRAHVFLQVVKQLSVLARTSDSYELHVLRHAVSLVLHHDAITGTSQQHVTNDFLKILSEAIDLCTKKISTVLSYLTPTWGGSRHIKNYQQFVICHQMNTSQCRFFETQLSTILLIYNPLSVKTYFHVRLPAVALHYSIRDFSDEEVDYQLVPLPTAVINLPGRTITTVQELVFEAENIPPLGYSAFLINAIRDPLAENSFAKKSQQPNNDNLEQEVTPFISNEYMKVTVNKDTGLLESIAHTDGIKLQVFQNFLYYGQAQQQGLQSGAYTFRPDKNKPTPVSEKATFQVIRGSLVKEIRQRFNDWVTQIIRLYRGEEFVELEWIIGPVPIGTDIGKEVVSVFTTNITNNGEFFTDSNGRQMMKRTCYNETTSPLQKKALPSCYYPVTSRICIHSANSSVEMCVLTDRPQGGTSYEEGQIELMVHRRLLTDDGFGLDETLNEEAHGVGLVVKGKHRIIFGNYKQIADELTFTERVGQLGRRWLMEPWVFLTSGDKVNRRKWQNVRTKRYSPLYPHGLPRSIHILTLEPWKAGSVLLRLENTLEKADRGHRPEKSEPGEESPLKSGHITVDLRKIFLLPVKLIRETTLAANQWLDDARQMDWSTRYVYSGGDDGILPEDIDYGEDKSTRIQETSTTSDEEADYTRKRKKQPQRAHSNARNKKKNLHYDYDRKKRSTNFTENVTEIANVTNVNDNKEINNDLSEYNDTNVEKETKPRNITEDIDVVEKRTKSTDGFVKKQKMKNRPAINAEMGSSEEETSSYLRRFRRKMERGSLKTNRAVSEAIDDSDDGVTKSIYEMYYKSKPRPRTSFKPFIRNSEEQDSTSKIRKDFRDQGRIRKTGDYDSVEITTRRPRRKRPKKKARVDAEDVPMPFFSDSRKLKDFSTEDNLEDGLKRDADGKRSRGQDDNIDGLRNTTQENYEGQLINDQHNESSLERDAHQLIPLFQDETNDQRNESSLEHQEDQLMNGQHNERTLEHYNDQLRNDQRNASTFKHDEDQLINGQHNKSTLKHYDDQLRNDQRNATNQEHDTHPLLLFYQDWTNVQHNQSSLERDAHQLIPLYKDETNDQRNESSLEHQEDQLINGQHNKSTLEHYNDQLRNDQRNASTFEHDKGQLINGHHNESTLELHEDQLINGQHNESTLEHYNDQLRNDQRNTSTFEHDLQVIPLYQDGINDQRNASALELYKEQLINGQHNKSTLKHYDDQLRNDQRNASTFEHSAHPLLPLYQDGINDQRNASALEHYDDQLRNDQRNASTFEHDEDQLINGQHNKTTLKHYDDQLRNDQRNATTQEHDTYPLLLFYQDWTNVQQNESTLEHDDDQLINHQRDANTLKRDDQQLLPFYQDEINDQRIASTLKRDKDQLLQFYHGRLSDQGHARLLADDAQLLPFYHSATCPLRRLDSTPGTSRPVARQKRRKDSYDSVEYDIPNASFERDQGNEDNDDHGGERKKRSMPSEEADPKMEGYIEDSEEYLVTLRPTQIRTFVIWFQAIKKP